MAERGITVSYESIRYWCIKFGSIYSRRLKRRHQGFGDTFFMDEVFVKIGGIQHYLWRAIDQDGEVVDVFLQKSRNATAAKRFFNLFNLQRHCVRAEHYRRLRASAFTEWNCVVA